MRSKLVHSIFAVLATFLVAGLTAQDAAAQQQKPKPAATKPKPAVPATDEAPVAPVTTEVRPNAAAPVTGANGEGAVAPASSPRPDAARVEFSSTQELSLGYVLGVGDVVRVNVFQQPDMTTETRVSETGTITVPLLGPVAVAGATAKRAEERIVALLKSRGFVRDPQVVVTVLQFKSRQVSVLGLVSRPGRYSLEEGVYRLSDVLALAGGALPDGADEVTLVRVIDGKSQKYSVDLPSLFKSGDFTNNPEIIAGDSIYVARAPLFYIYGEVNRPGAFRIEKGMTVMQALSMGCGISQRGTEKNVELRRRDATGQYVTYKGALTDAVQPNDVIFVRESLF